ncbi:MAG TPA: PQQ-binding-like beta-propeller repeat protein [Polyangiaceae bacterium]|nr:PQQ-binding-like beta-propeller repeat protein [Polyangiaceae bacterium]
MALALSACRTTPTKPTTKATPSETAARAAVNSIAAPASAASAGSAGPDSAPAVAATSNFIDRGFPNENQPELVTARRLFPSAFGFDDGRPQTDVNHALIYSSRLFDHLPRPPSYCLNSVAQPSIADLQLHLLLGTNIDETNRTFTFEESLVLKDRSQHYVIAVPKGANGVLMLPPPAPSFGRHDNDPTDESFSVVLSDVTVIYPDGRSLRLPPGENRYAGGAILVVTDRMRVRLCANDPRYKANGCPDSDPRVRMPDPPPRDFDLRRCEPGCEQACTRKELRQPACPTPPSPQCLGDKQRVFLDGRNVGGYCVFEEWDIHCETGCNDAQCASAPRLAWSRKIGEGYLAFALDAQTLGLTEGDELVTISAEGALLHRDKPFKSKLSRLASDAHGTLFTLDMLNVLRAHGKQPWSLQLDDAAPAFETGLRYRKDQLYLTRATGVTCLNPADGRQRWHVEIGSNTKSQIAVSETSLAVLTTGNEVVVIDLNGIIRGRAKLPAEALGRFVVTGDTVTVYVKTGEVLSGRFDSLKAIATIPQAEWMPVGLAQLSEQVVLLNRGTDHHDKTTIHALQLPTGRTLWTYAASGQLQWDPPIDRHGNLFLVGRRLTSLAPDGKERFQVDFRGGPQSEAAATLGLDGASLYVRDHRGLTKFTGL